MQSQASTLIRQCSILIKHTYCLVFMCLHLCLSLRAMSLAIHLNPRIRHLCAGGKPFQNTVGRRVNAGSVLRRSSSDGQGEAISTNSPRIVAGRRGSAVPIWTLTVQERRGCSERWSGPVAPVSVAGRRGRHFPTWTLTVQDRGAPARVPCWRCSRCWTN